MGMAAAAAELRKDQEHFRCVDRDGIDAERGLRSDEAHEDLIEPEVQEALRQSADPCTQPEVRTSPVSKVRSSRGRDARRRTDATSNIDAQIECAMAQTMIARVAVSPSHA